jgi:Mg2+ and Co2+ transporter CorA
MDKQIEEDILIEVNKLENKIKNLDYNILKDNKFVFKNLYIYKKKLIKISIEYDEYLLNNNKNKIIEHKIKNINKNIKLLIEFHNLNINIQKHKKINNISFINTICLPLALITGYFGMNFYHMGNPSLKRGILSINNSNKFVFILFFISILSTLLLFHYNILF